MDFKLWRVYIYEYVSVVHREDGQDTSVLKLDVVAVSFFTVCLLVYIREACKRAGSLVYPVVFEPRLPPSRAISLP